MLGLLPEGALYVQPTVFSMGCRKTTGTRLGACTEGRMFSSNAMWYFPGSSPSPSDTSEKSSSGAEKGINC